MNDDDLERLAQSRYAYGQAAQILEGRQLERAWGHWRPDEADEGPILAEVLRQLGPSADPEIVEEAVRDAIAGRRPKW